jgi:hypothetical protein
MKRLILIFFVVLAAVGFYMTTRMEDIQEHAGSAIREENKIALQMPQKPAINEDHLIESSNGFQQKNLKAEEKIQARNITVAEAEKEIERDEVVAKLNGDNIKLTERTALFSRLKELDLLRIKKIEADLVAIDQEVAELLAGHNQRLISFGVKQP